MNAPSPVVLDTNIFVAAGFNPQSNAARIVQRIRDGELRLIWHAHIRAETKKIIRQIPPLSWNRFESLFTPEGKYDGPITPEDYGMVADPADRKFAALAAATNAILVSNDRHLLSVRDQFSITVLTPKELARRENS